MIRVTCAIIEQGDQVLICQRSEKMKLPLKWEFPGGKIEPFETKEQCIVREIREELNLNVEVLRPLAEVTHQYPNFSINLMPFVCRLLGGDLQLKEHKQAIWVDKSALGKYDWADADVPVVNFLSC